MSYYCSMTVLFNIALAYLLSLCSRPPKPHHTTPGLLPNPKLCSTQCLSVLLALDDNLILLWIIMFSVSTQALKLCCTLCLTALVPFDDSLTLLWLLFSISTERKTVREEREGGGGERIQHNKLSLISRINIELKRTVSSFRIGMIIMCNIESV